MQLGAEAELGGQRYWPTANASGSPSSRTSCVAPRPCARGALTVALVLRGELYRWGCDALGVSKQRQVARAYDAMLLTPLEQAGHCVHVVLALDRGCGAARDADLAAMYGDRVALAQHSHPPAAVARPRDPGRRRGVRWGDADGTVAFLYWAADFVAAPRHDVPRRPLVWARKPAMRRTRAVPVGPQTGARRGFNRSTTCTSCRARCSPHFLRRWDDEALEGALLFPRRASARAVTAASTCSRPPSWAAEGGGGGGGGGGETPRRGRVAAFAASGALTSLAPDARR